MIDKGVILMINIRPVSDLRNKYTEIENLVLENGEEEYLTKNGYGTMVVMSISKYAEMVNEVEYNKYIEYSLDEAEMEADNPNTNYYTHKEIFDEIRSKLNEK